MAEYIIYIKDKRRIFHLSMEPILNTNVKIPLQIISNKYFVKKKIICI